MAAILALACATAAAAPIPPDLVGIWATEGSEFKGEALWKGQALYLDIDGVGASAGGDGSDVIGVRIVVTSYNSVTNLLSFDITEYGKVVGSGTLTYELGRKTLFSPKDRAHYHRRSNGISAEIRKGLGLEPRTQ